MGLSVGNKKITFNVVEDGKTFSVAHVLRHMTTLEELDHMRETHARENIENDNERHEHFILATVAWWEKLCIAVEGYEFAPDLAAAWRENVLTDHKLEAVTLLLRKKAKVERPDLPSSKNSAPASSPATVPALTTAPSSCKGDSPDSTPATDAGATAAQPTPCSSPG